MQKARALESFEVYYDTLEFPIKVHSETCTFDQHLAKVEYFSNTVNFDSDSHSSSPTEIISRVTCTFGYKFYHTN